jgi:hypothetical protein
MQQNIQSAQNQIAMYEKISTGFLLVTVFVFFLRLIDNYYDSSQRHKNENVKNKKKEDDQVGLSIDDDDENEEYIFI